MTRWVRTLLAFVVPKHDGHDREHQVGHFPAWIAGSPEIRFPCDTHNDFSTVFAVPLRVRSCKLRVEKFALRRIR